MAVSKLFTPTRIGALTVPNRVVMAPMTRSRARHDGDVPTELNATYYAQRAAAGLIISEASQISPEGKGYPWTPGIYSAEQVSGWRRVTDAVHDAGGRIFLQLWHVGRISHVCFQPDEQTPVAPSAIIANAQTFNADGFVQTSQPRALDIGEMPRLVDDYVKAAGNAQDAGFDGVEIHAANGYLLDQFLRDRTNQRTDAYGGSIAKRARLPLEVVEAVVRIWGGDRVGIRLSPFSNFCDMDDSNPMALFGYVIAKLNDFGLAYLHMVEGHTGGPRDLPHGAEIHTLRHLFKGPYIANNGYDREFAIRAVEEGDADVVAFARLFLANPDLVERLRRNTPLNIPNQATFYGGAAEGYTDYPALPTN